MASVVTSHPATQAKGAYRRQEERETDSPQLVKTVERSKASSSVVVPSVVSSIRSYGIYDEVMRQHAVRQMQEQCVNEQIARFDHNDQVEGTLQKRALPLPGMESTPRPASAKDITLSPAPRQTSVTRHLSSMMDDMMREVFAGEASHGETGGHAGEAPVKALDLSVRFEEVLHGGEEEAFTIPALPSPTREQRAVLSHGGQEQSKEVVLEMDVMSPLLKEMQEIERVSKGGESGGIKGIEDIEEAQTEEVRPQEVEAPFRGREEGREGAGQDQVKRVPSLIQYFQDQARDRRASVQETEAASSTTSSVAKAVVTAVRTQARRVVGSSKKPPLLPVHNGSHVGSSLSLAFLETWGLQDRVENLVTLATKVTHGRRKMLAVIALSYLVLLHVFLISGRLRVG